ncbi:MAG TPA: DNA gyrase inhibitor YacG [Pyrinomonadaceae bacterium]|nr:DNA gyrase inhibitor YacG [Pyrinomonadaceae bacterium]
MSKCPTCGKPVEWKDNLWRPFCSERCKLIDFGRWADEEYRVPGQRINAAEIAEPSADETEDDENAATVNRE